MVTIHPIGIVHSDLKIIKDCPLQENENAPQAVLEIFKEYDSAAEDIKMGDELIVLTWLNQADRAVLKTHPRNDASTMLTGVFSTRSPHRPNPLGIHWVKVLSVHSSSKITVSSLEVLDQTPLIDIKPVTK